MTKKVEVRLTYVTLRQAQDDISFDGACPELAEGLRMTFPSTEPVLSLPKDSG